MYKLEPHFQLIRLILALVCCDCLLYCSIFLTIQFHLFAGSSIHLLGTSPPSLLETRSKSSVRVLVCLRCHDDSC